MMHVETWYLEALAKEIHNAKKRVEALAHQVYPSEILSEFVRGELLETIDALWSIVSEQLNEFDQSVDTPLSPRCAKVILLWNSGYVQSVIASVSEADIHSHPLEMMLYIRELARQVVPNDPIEVVTVPVEWLNYSFREIWAHLRPVLSEILELSPESAVKYVELTYPKGEKDNILRSTVFAHELGHYVDHALGLTDTLLAAAYAAVIPRVPMVRRKGVVSPGASDPVLAELVVSGILKNWLQEAIADGFAIRVLGPAYYFCYAEIAGLLGGTQAEERIEILDSRVDSHPRRSLRIQYQYELLKGFALGLPQETRKAVDDTLTLLQTRARVVHHTTTISNKHAAIHLAAPVYELVESVWESLLPQVTAVVDAIVPVEVRFSSADYKLATTLVNERLVWLIPPNEHDGQPVKPSVIINAGWHARQFSLNKMWNSIASLPEGLEGTHDAVDMLNGLLKYALYAAHVHERWEGA